MANFRRGAEAIQEATVRSGGGKFVPTHKWEDGETKYLQFLTSIDEIPTVLMHRFIDVGKREDGSTIWRDFISRRDPALDGADGYDELIDRFGSQPSNRCIALAVELEPEFEKQGTRKVLTGFGLVYRQYTNSEDEEKEVPNVALVIESPYTFFNHLTAFAEIGKNIEDFVFAVKRTGKQTNTSYSFAEAGDAFDFGDELDEFLTEFDFEAYLEDLADEDRMRSELEDVPDDYVVNKWSVRKKKAKNTEAPKKTATTRRRVVVNDEADEATEDGDGEEAVEPEAEEPVRKRKFAELRKDMKS